METATPMLKQYHRIKAQHRDCILFFRLGDFYEMFFEDAQEASRILDLVLTSRGKGTASHVPMCGIPYHAAEGYIARLIKAGKKVAICEQMEDPALAKGIVQRDVIRTISSGTFLDDASPDARYLMCVSPGNKNKDPLGIAFIDPAAGAMLTNAYPSARQALEVLVRLPVTECLYPESRADIIQNLLHHPLLKTNTIVLSPYEDWIFNPELARKTLQDHFSVKNLAGFGIDDIPEAISAAGALLEYLRIMNKQPLKHVDRIALYADQNYVHISPAATFGLELDSLYRTMDRTLCALGRRQLRYWLFHPLKSPAAILERQAAVTLLKNEAGIQKELKELLSGFPDIEKCLSKLSCGLTQPKDLLALRNALCSLPALKQACAPLAARNRFFALDDIPALRQSLEKAINPDMPLTNAEGKIIRPGFYEELDSLRGLQESGRQWLKNYQQKEAARSGINSLKVGYNKIFGYYIEVTKSHLKSVPVDYIRKQTLVNGERFITPELKEYEEKILTAQDKILKIEDELIKRLTAEILNASVALHHFARLTAELDAIFSLSALAREPHYIAPAITEDTVIDIKEGRHPVVENKLGENFIPNDTYLDCDDNHLIILTGPNMAGKSTYIRQIALLVIMAQMGSYIPAAEARVGIVDKIYTRIGAHDDISKGQSTFMVEMTEAADILNNLSDRSLVILDEIGRGTSTYDGLSLAWALAEHLQQSKARTLFATHFHELTALANEYPGIKNYNVTVKEWKGDIIFLHKIVPGGTDDSYGIYVAKLAGVPKPILARAQKILSRLELQSDIKEKLAASSGQDHQLTFFQQDAVDPTTEQIIDILRAMDINSLTPLEALNKLQDIKNILEK
ncbi:MAG TPA: DNA mismatch repair protein MutS [Candidatus Omnitrophota bacterium]|nr:DNA mismatch repair protein MutS [Candidatus Omnitrophota bacterium]HQO58681.1 DNA mismatch repair protein MutS [Candidatus Omnitrophota bacterium]HQP11413.1 DNA mismatch repair protein MutS [Candidatus Omnitrophota bacterium]